MLKHVTKGHNCFMSKVQGAGPLVCPVAIARVTACLHAEPHTHVMHNWIVRVQASLPPSPSPPSFGGCLQAYMFSIPKNELQSFGMPCAGKEWKEGLVIDSRDTGNISRFINCCWGREAGEGDLSHVNVKAEYAWNLDSHRPVVRLRATRWVVQGGAHASNKYRVHSCMQ